MFGFLLPGRVTGSNVRASSPVARLFSNCLAARWARARVSIMEGV